MVAGKKGKRCLQTVSITGLQQTPSSLRRQLKYHFSKRKPDTDGTIKPSGFFNGKHPCWEREHYSSFRPLAGQISAGSLPLTCQGKPDDKEPLSVLLQ